MQKLSRAKSLLTVWFCVFATIGWGQTQKQEVLAGVAVVKLSPAHRLFFETSMRKLGSDVTIRPMFPGSNMPSRSVHPNAVDLSLIYEVKSGDPELLQTLGQLSVFEYVEPRYVYYTTFTPNDPELPNQNYLTQIRAFGGWDSQTGKANVTIGVVDTGTDLDHPDLQSELALNTQDPINGIDDDGDGYVDNYWGWDFIDGDGEPQIGESDHGIHVAGIAAAATNNSKGVASVGYQCTYLPVRVGNGRAITHGFEGIVYAADQGCDIINCSWGGGAFSQYGQDVVNYVTYNKGALIIAASGNSGADNMFYPAAYQSVLAVGSVDQNNVKSSFSNYGYWIDVMAPGQNVLSTVDNGMYARNTGTSMAAPMVAGLAGLIKSKYPGLSALQIAARIEATAINIDGNNPSTMYKNGAGLINCEAALDGNITNVFVDVNHERITNNQDDVYRPNELVYMYAVFTNALAEASNVQAVLRCTSSFIQMADSVIDIGSMGVGEQWYNGGQPFRFFVRNNTPANTPITLFLEVESDQGVQTYAYDLTVAQDYRNVTANNVGVSIGSKGQVGYNTKAQTEGIGMRYLEEESQLFEGGLMVGVMDGAIAKVVDNIRSNDEDSDDDFAVVTPIDELGPVNNYRVFGEFNDGNALLDSLGISVHYEVSANDSVGKSNYVIAAYSIANNSAKNYSDMAVGLFTDFDVMNYQENKMQAIGEKYLAYTRGSESASRYFGVQLLTPQKFNAYGIDNVDGGAGGVDMFNRFISIDKWTTLSTMRYHAGVTADVGNDVAQVVSGKNITLLAGDTVHCAFALIAAPSYEELLLAADSAFYSYNGVLPVSTGQGVDGVSWYLYPNPVGNSLHVRFPIASAPMGWRVVNILGQVVMQQKISNFNGLLQLDVSGLPSGMYYLSMEGLSGEKWIKSFKK